MTNKMTAPELMTLVRHAALVFEQRGEKAFPQFRKKGGKWFFDDTYFFVYEMDGMRILNAGNPSIEGQSVRETKDVIGRPYGNMFLDVAATEKGEGWVHYMYPEPGDIFPAWKSSFVKRVTFPSGKQYLIGSGIYNMQMDRAFIEDVVNRAAMLVKDNGKEAFTQIRDKTGSFNFMDIYVFVDNTYGIELVNGAQPSLEGMNLMDKTDAHGKFAVRDYINAALDNGSAWVEYYWYKPGENTPVLKHTYVRKVQHNGDVYILGAGYYEEEKMKEEM
jgi:signal transduction histidine kinase